MSEGIHNGLLESLHGVPRPILADFYSTGRLVDAEARGKLKPVQEILNEVWKRTGGLKAESVRLGPLGSGIFAEDGISPRDPAGRLSAEEKEGKIGGNRIGLSRRSRIGQDQRIGVSIQASTGSEVLFGWMREVCAVKELRGSHQIEIGQSRLRAGPLEKRRESFLSLVELTQQLPSGLHCPVAVSDPSSDASILLPEAMEVRRGRDMEDEDAVGRVLWDQRLLGGGEERWRHSGAAPIEDLPLNFLESAGGESYTARKGKPMVVASLLHPAENPATPP
ncbi:MAG TPA: hypothetical protein VGX68_20860 [Thermoanaerobaculia bacterium]|nr:hypothetical protein [Thermoanaerobaculia bacterium]